jgi:predicted phage terminase large subunit-like protein
MSVTNRDVLLKELLTIEAEIAKIESTGQDDETELEKLLEEELTMLAEANLYHFVVASWQYIARGEFRENWYVDAICEHLMALRTGQIKKLAIGIAPRHAKSTICSVAFPVWSWVQDATHTFITASYGESLVVRDAVASRRLINTTWFQRRFGRLFKLRSDTNQKSRYENDKGGFRLATSVEGKGTGEGCRTLIIDDPHKALEAHSRVSKDKVSSWYFDTMSSRWESADTFTQLIVHQRLAEDDLIGRVLTEDSGWEYFALPIEYDPDHSYTTSLGFEDPRREPGELLAPNLMSEDVVAREKKKGEWRWASQFQQQPVPKGGGYVKSEQIMEYSDAGLPAHFDMMVASWDLANSNKNDYCVGTVWGKLGSRRYLIDCIRRRMTFPQQIEAILSLKTKYPDIRAVLIEKKSNGQAAIDTLQRYVSGLIPMEPRDYGGDKESRLIACTPEFEAGNVYFPALSNGGKLWVRECKAELLMFPKGKTDDFVDSTSYALLYLAKYGQTLKQYNTIDVEASNVQSPIDLFDVRLINDSAGYYNNLFG